MKFKFLDNILDKYVYLNDTLDKYVYVVTLKQYELIIGKYKSTQQDRNYYRGIRIMWSNKVNRAILITKEKYNKVYNPCSFVKLI